MAAIPAIPRNQKLVVLTRHSRKCLQQAFQVLSRFNVADIQEIRSMSLSARNRWHKFRAGRQWRYANAIFGDSQVTNDFRLGIFRIGDDQPRVPRYSWNKPPGVETFAKRVSVTQNFKAHVMNRHNIRPLFGYGSEEIRVMAHVGPDLIEYLRQQKV